MPAPVELRGPENAEIVNAVERNPAQLRGLASYDALRVGESLRWIDEAVAEGGVSGAYARCGVLDQRVGRAPHVSAVRTLRQAAMPVVLGFNSAERWTQHLSQVEVVAADFPELDILLAPPAGAEAASILRLMRHFPRISFLLCPQEMQADAALCEYIEMQGRERALFRSAARDGRRRWRGRSAATESGGAACLSVQNATRVYGFPVGVASSR